MFATHARRHFTAWPLHDAKHHFTCRMAHFVCSKKKDAKDAEWIAGLLQHGLLRTNYIPSKELQKLTRSIAQVACRTT